MYHLETVVTAFPRRWTSAADQEEPTGNQARLEAAKDISDVYGRILSALFGNNRTVSVTDLVCLITDKCSGLFHSRTDEVVDELDYLDVFAVEIGRLVSYVEMETPTVADENLGKRANNVGQCSMGPVYAAQKPARM
jgi:hypothetical protein